MLIALLADTHDNTANLQAALELLRPYQPVAYLHAGDVTLPATLQLMVGTPAHIICGNNDNPAALARACQRLGLTWHNRLAQLRIAGKTIAMTHGDDTALCTDLVDLQQHDYMVYGHTHKPSDQRFGRMRVINPGALHRAHQRTVAILDVAADKLEFISIPERRA